MANSYVQYTGNGVDYAVPFQYLSKTHISVKVDGTAVPFTWTSPNMVQLTSDPGTGLVEIRRTTPNNTRVVDFTDGSVLAANDLDQSALQFLFLSQEAQDVANLAIQPSGDGQWDVGGRRVENAADPVDDQDLVTKKWAQTAMTSQVAQATAQAQAAAGSASAAAGSATAAAASQSAAAGSQAAAKTSETNAASSASAAAGSATTATQQATAAGTSATNAHTSEVNAAASATAAAGSATSASGSASAASTSLSQAISAAQAAGTSATNAHTSEVNAAASAAAAAQSAEQAAQGGYTKSETDTLLAAKADKSDTYTKEQVDAALLPKADTATVNASLSDKLSMSAGGTVNGRVMFTDTEIGATGMQDLQGSGMGSITVASKGTVQQSVAAFEFFNQGRGSAYLGLDWDFTLKFGGGAYGDQVYRLFHQGNLNPLQGVRLAIAGDKQAAQLWQDAGSPGSGIGNIVEDFPGSVVTGLGGTNNGGSYLWAARFRYLQVQDQNGNWVTVSYVG
jgi:hypothetical protein